MRSSYRDLRVWQQAMQLVVAIYRCTQAFPKSELYGLTNQLRRAAVSIPSNIAEGKGRSTDRDRNVFFCRARGSLLELETQILIATELNYLTDEQSEDLMHRSTRLGQMLNALIESLRPEAVTSAA